mgnify:CR=1 FL=1
MSKWEIPAKGGNMEVNNGIYYQNMTNIDVAERLKKNDVILIPVGSTENHGPSAPYGEWLKPPAAQLRSRFGMVLIHIIIWVCRAQ